MSSLSVLFPIVSNDSSSIAASNQDPSNGQKKAKTNTDLLLQSNGANIQLNSVEDVERSGKILEASKHTDLMGLNLEWKEEGISRLDEASRNVKENMNLNREVNPMLQAFRNAFGSENDSRGHGLDQTNIVKKTNSRKSSDRMTALQVAQNKCAAKKNDLQLAAAKSVSHFGSLLSLQSNMQVDPPELTQVASYESIPIVSSLTQLFGIDEVDSMPQEEPVLPKKECSAKNTRPASVSKSLVFSPAAPAQIIPPPSQISASSHLISPPVQSSDMEVECKVVSSAMTLAAATTIFPAFDLSVSSFELSDPDVLSRLPDEIVSVTLQNFQAQLNSFRDTHEMDWNEMNLLIVALRKQNVLPQMEVDVLKFLISECQKQMALGAELNILETRGTNASVRQVFISSFDAACIILCIITAPGINLLQLASEDCVENCVYFFSAIVHNTILPVYKRKEINKSQCFEDKDLEGEQDEDEAAPVVSKKRKKSALLGKSELQQVAQTEANLDFLFSRLREYLARLQISIRLHLIHASLLQRLVSSIIPLFELEVSSHIQIAASVVLISIFVHHDSFRQSILSDLVNCMYKIRLVHFRAMRTFSLSGTSQSESCIDMNIALVMQLLQSIPSFHAEEVQKVKVALLENMSKKNSTSESFFSLIQGSIESTSKYSQYFISQFFCRFFETKSIDFTPSDIKVIISDLLNDIIVVTFIPEWPIAEDLLHMFALHFAKFILPKYDSSDSEHNHKSVALEMIGSIASSVKKNVRLASMMKLNRALNEPSKCNVCHNPLEKEFFKCQHCFSLFHSTCAGIHLPSDYKEVNHKQIFDNWTCTVCSMQLQSESNMKLFANALLIDKKVANGQMFSGLVRKDKEDVYSTLTLLLLQPERVLRQEILDYLTHKSKFQLSFSTARQYYLSRWFIDDLNAENLESTALSLVGDSLTGKKKETAVAEKKKMLIESAFLFIRSQWMQNQDVVNVSYSALNFCNLEFLISINRQISEKGRLLNSFQKLFSLILTTSSHPKPAIRVKCLKVLADMLNDDYSLLKENHCRKVVYDRLDDSATSVRESAIDLIGRHILFDIDLVYQYHAMLLLRLNDAGVSVRKRVIKIVGEICLKFPQHKNYIGLCAKIISLFSDSELSIRSLIVKTFLTSWFVDISDVAKQHIKKEFNDIPALLEKRLLDLSFIQKEAGEDFVKLLGAIYKQVPAIALVIGYMSRGLIFLIIHGITVHDGVTTETAIPWMIKLLQSFSILVPSCVIDHIQLLVPYLKCNRALLQDNSEAVRLEAISSIFRSALPLAAHFPDRFFAEIQSDLRTLCLQAPLNVLREAVPCYTVLVNVHLRESSAIVELFNVCANIMFTNLSNENANTEKQVPRCLLLIGLLSKYYNIDSISADIMDHVFSKLSNKKLAAKLSDVILLIFKHYCISKNPSIKRMALQSVCDFFSQRPDVLPQFSVIIKSVLHDASQDLVPLKLILLRSMLQFLKSEQHRMENFQAHSQTTAKLNDTASLFTHSLDSSGPTIEMMQSLLDSILLLCNHSLKQVRVAAFQLIQLINTQGMVLPSLLIPTYICGLIDEQTTDLCASELKSVLEKFADYFPANFGSGLRLAFEALLLDSSFDFYSSELYTTVVSGLQRLYNLIKSQSKLRNIWLRTFFEQFAKEMQSVSSTKDVIGATNSSLSYCAFLSNILVLMNYDHDEALHIVFHISNLVSLSGGKIDSTITQVFELMEKQIALEEKIAPELLVSGISCCHQGTVVCCLVLVKNFVKSLYGLSDNKIDNWNPEKVSKLTFKKRADPFATFNLNALVLYSSQQELTNVIKGQSPATLLFEQYRAIRSAIENDYLYYYNAALTTGVLSKPTPKTSSKSSRKKSARNPRKKRKELEESDLSDEVAEDHSSEMDEEPEPTPRSPIVTVKSGLASNPPSSTKTFAKPSSSRTRKSSTSVSDAQLPVLAPAQAEAPSLPADCTYPSKRRISAPKRFGCF